jgi:hypothetical protein
MTQADPLAEQCTANAKGSGVRCLITVVGGGVCRKHGGGAPAVKAAREARVLAARAQAAGGVVVARDPGDALLGATQDADAMVQRIKAVIEGSGELKASEVRAFGEWLDRTGRLGKMTLDARVDERRVRITELQHAELFAIIAAVLAELGHDPDSPETIEIVRSCAARVGAGGRARPPAIRAEVIVQASETGAATDD